jgi:hypothetical protein
MDLCESVSLPATAQVAIQGLSHVTARRMSALLRTLILVGVTTLGGCRPVESLTGSANNENSSRDSTGLASRPEPEDALQAMIRAYREAPVYSDRGEIVLTFRTGGALRRDAAPLSVAFQRPGQLKVQAYQVQMASDGEVLQARIEDEASANLDGQVVMREMPPQLSLPWLFEDSLLHEVLQQGLGRQPIQLELLLSEHPIAEFLAPSARRRYLDDQTLHGRRCHRIQVETREGSFIFWLDPQQWLLRRLEYPTDSLRTTAESNRMVSDMKLIADFHDSRFAALGDRFGLEEIPSGAKVLRRFVRPPQPLPTNLFAEPVPPFQLDQLRGRLLHSDDLRGKVAVLHWYVEHPACQASLERLQQSRRRWEGRDDVVFFAVNAESPTTPAEVIEQRMVDWGFDIPVLRDRQAVGRDVFDIQALPTVVVLGADGTVQLFESTFNPLLDEHLEVALQRIDAGEDLGLSVIAQAQHDSTQYQQRLVAATPLEQQGTHSVALTPATEPTHVRLRKLWTCDEVSRPGNLITVPGDEGNFQVYVLQGGTEVIELDQRGTVRSHHALPVQEDEHLTILRTGETAEGNRYFVAAEWGGQRLYLLDSRWQRQWTAPPPELRHEGISDVQFVDWNGDGQPEICVLLAGVGLIAWNLDGNEVVRIPSIPGTSLAPAPRTLLHPHDPNDSAGRRSSPDVLLSAAISTESAATDTVATTEAVVESVLLVTTDNGRIANVASIGPPEA